jgi:hypothetical protein
MANSSRNPEGVGKSTHQDNRPIVVKLVPIPKFIPRQHKEDVYGEVEGRGVGQRLQESMLYGAYD